MSRYWQSISSCSSNHFPAFNRVQKISIFAWNHTSVHGLGSWGVGGKISGINRRERRKPTLHVYDVEVYSRVKTRLALVWPVAGASPVRRAAHFRDRNIKPKIYSAGVPVPMPVPFGRMYDFRPWHDRPRGSPTRHRRGMVRRSTIKLWAAVKSIFAFSDFCILPVSVFLIFSLILLSFKEKIFILHQMLNLYQF